MTPKYSPIIATLLLIGSQAINPVGAHAAEAKAATLDAEPPEAVRIRCFMGASQDQMRTTRAYDDLGRGWFCVPEEKPASTH